jgi:membrane fusion protein (multidrug efflux system)
VDAFSKLTFEGRIKKINPIVNPKSRTCNISILIDNKDLILKPGMFARGYVIVDVKPECLSFNKLALIADETTVEDDIRKIFIVKDGYAISKKVRIGIECGENIEIIGDVAPGELVVVDGQNKLTDFVKVFYKMNKNND